jgi:hypothetical protein
VEFSVSEGVEEFVVLDVVSSEFVNSIVCILVGVDVDSVVFCDGKVLQPPRINSEVKNAINVLIPRIFIGYSLAGHGTPVLA